MLATAALTLGALAVASAAHARSDVYFSIGIQSPGYYVQPAPVYVQPRPVYLPAPAYYGRHDNDRRHGGQYRERRGPYGDRDRDGIRNRFDRVPNNPYRR